ncbi:MAG TPA: hypothetical protein VF759_11070 [Allosphingosinicella sp.]|jgi:hypothetical protein
MKTELPKDDHPAAAFAITKKSWLKPSAAVVETRRAEGTPGTGVDGMTTCHS